jgi:uncharacterized protein
MRKILLAEIQESIKQFSDNQKIILGIAIAERMLPNYRAFSEKYAFGDAGVLENTIQLLKNNALPIEKSELLEAIEENAPDTEDFPSNLMATAALDTAAVVHELVLMSMDSDLEHLLTICSLALNAPFMCIHIQKQDPYQNPIMQAEIALLKKWIANVQENSPLENPENEWVERIRQAA